MPHYRPLPDFRGICPMCAAACTAELVTTRIGGQPVSNTYAGCEHCGWEGPSDLTLT